MMIFVPNCINSASSANDGSREWGRPRRGFDLIPIHRHSLEEIEEDYLLRLDGKTLTKTVGMAHKRPVG